jgi:hypothetical protein
MLWPLRLLLLNCWQLQGRTRRRQRSEASAGGDLLPKYVAWRRQQQPGRVCNVSLHIASYKAGKDVLSLHGRSMNEVKEPRLQDPPYSALLLLLLFILCTPARSWSCASIAS